MLECQNLCERREAYLSTCGVSALLDPQEMKSEVWPHREQQSKSLPGMFKNSRLIILWWTLVVTKLGIYSFNLKHTNNEKIVKKHFYKDPFKPNILKLLKSQAISLQWFGLTIITRKVGVQINKYYRHTIFISIQILTLGNHKQSRFQKA